MKSFHIPRTALFFILFALAAFAVLYRPIDLKALVRASSQGTLRTEEVAHFGSTNDMDYHLLSMDSEEFQQTAELLSTVSCRKKLNQNYSAYTHDTFPVQSVTVSFYDDAENQKFLLTVYSDGVCILNSAFVSVKYPGGGAAQLYEQLAGMGQRKQKRGVQLVKLHAPFLFSLRRLWYQTQPVPRRKLQSKPCCRFP